MARLRKRTRRGETRNGSGNDPRGRLSAAIGRRRPFGRRNGGIVSRARLPLIFTVLGALALLGGTAGAERSQQGNLIVTLNGGIAPRQLPRHKAAPVAVHLAGRVLTSDHAPLPRVNWIRLELAWRGVLDTQGLPVCPEAQLKITDTRHAIARCGAAEVGRGRLFAKIFVPGQQPFGIRARLVAFNGKTRAGRPAVLVHAYAGRPPVAFVIPFTIHHKTGAFRTVLTTTIRRSVGPWPHVADFQIDIQRSFNYQGRLHHYLSASCPVPTGFSAGFLSFARATYTFEGGEQLTTESVRSCRAGND